MPDGLMGVIHVNSSQAGVAGVLCHSAAWEIA